MSKIVADPLMVARTYGVTMVCGMRCCKVTLRSNGAWCRKVSLCVKPSTLRISFPIQPIELAGLAARALVTAPLAPWAARLSRSLRERLDESEARRDMRLDTRRPVLR